MLNRFLSAEEKRAAFPARLIDVPEALCWPDFRVTTWALCIHPPFAKIDSG